MKPSPKEYVQVGAGEEVFPTIYKKWRVGCCDCGLVHNMEFTLYREGKKIKSPSKKGYRIALRAWRNPEDTEKLRSTRKYIKK